MGRRCKAFHPVCYWRRLALFLMLWMTVSPFFLHPAFGKFFIDKNTRITMLKISIDGQNNISGILTVKFTNAKLPNNTTSPHPLIILPFKIDIDDYPREDVELNNFPQGSESQYSMIEIISTNRDVFDIKFHIKTTIQDFTSEATFNQPHDFLWLLRKSSSLSNRDYTFDLRFDVQQSDPLFDDSRLTPLAKGMIVPSEIKVRFLNGVTPGATNLFDPGSPVAGRYDPRSGEYTIPIAFYEHMSSWIDYQLPPPSLEPLSPNDWFNAIFGTIFGLCVGLLALLSLPLFKEKVTISLTGIIMVLILLAALYILLFSQNELRIYYKQNSPTVTGAFASYLLCLIVLAIKFNLWLKNRRMSTPPPSVQSH